jgi:hypothetical protein
MLRISKARQQTGVTLYNGSAVGCCLAQDGRGSNVTGIRNSVEHAAASTMDAA